MANIDQNGIPEVVAAETAAGGTAIAEAVVVPATPSATFGSLVTDLLAQFEDESVIIIDANSRSVWAASGAEGIALGECAIAVAADMATLTPDSGQTGKSLTYTATGKSNLTSEEQAALALAIETAKPKRTIQSLVSNLLSFDPGENPLPVIMVDQNDGVVYVMDDEDGDDIKTALDGRANEGDRLKITLSEPTTEVVSPLIFEGGSTGS
jgi:hypothetical protein